MILDQLKQILNNLPEYMDDQRVYLRFNAYEMKQKFEPKFARWCNAPIPEIDGDDPDIEVEIEIEKVDPNMGWLGVFLLIGDNKPF